MSLKPLTMLAVLVFGCALPMGWADTRPLPVCCSGDFEKMELVPLPGIQAELTRLAADQGGPMLSLAFTKESDERRFLALETVPRQPLTEFKALSFSYTFSGDEALVLRPALMLYEKGNGVWFKTGRDVPPVKNLTEKRLSLFAFREAAFSRDESKALEWESVCRVWFGFVIDGKGAGSLKISKVVLTSEPFKPTEAVPLLNPDPGQWSLTADQAVKKEKTAFSAEGRTGIRFTFSFPGGKHMYFTPAQSVPELDYSAYRGVRIQYRAKVPAGIKGLLVQFHENGGGSFVPADSPSASGEWETVEIAFRDLKLAGWTKDPNGTLDVDMLKSISIGAHGVASGSGGDGEIIIGAVDLVP